MWARCPRQGFRNKKYKKIHQFLSVHLLGFKMHSIRLVSTVYTIQSSGPMWAGCPMSVSCSTLPTPNTTNIITSLHSRADPAAFSFFSSAKNSSKSQVFWLLRMFAQHIDRFLLLLGVLYTNDMQLPDQNDNPCVLVHIAGSPFPSSIIL